VAAKAQEDHEDLIIIILILITKIKLGVGCVVGGRRKNQNDVCG